MPPEVLKGAENEKKDLHDPSRMVSDMMGVMQGSDRRIIRAMDIFSMRFSFYNVLTVGKHPFRNLKHLREGWILAINRSDFSALEYRGTKFDHSNEISRWEQLVI